jgi:hypothetical protein
LGECVEGCGLAEQKEAEFLEPLFACVSDAPCSPQGIQQCVDALGGEEG